MRSLKEECLERLILFGEKALRNAVGEFLLHFHSERNHQWLRNQLIQPGAEVNKTQGEITCHHDWVACFSIIIAKLLKYLDFGGDSSLLRLRTDL